MKFPNLIDQRDDDSVEPIQEAEDLVLVYHFYNSYRRSAFESFGNEKLTEDAVKAVVSFCRKILKTDSKAHLFCSAFQYAKEIKALLKKV